MKSFSVMIQFKNWGQFSPDGVKTVSAPSAFDAAKNAYDKLKATPEELKMNGIVLETLKVEDINFIAVILMEDDPMIIPPETFTREQLETDKS